MTEEEAVAYTINLLKKHKHQSRELTPADYAEIKKWMRLAILFDGTKVHYYIPKYRIFFNNFSCIIDTMDFDFLMKLRTEVLEELMVEPLNDKDLEFVAKGVIQTISNKKNEKKKI
jgi:hypothetical protein